MELRIQPAWEYGHADALIALIEGLDSPSEWDRRAARASLYRVLDYRGPANGLQDWYAAHRAKLVFYAAPKGRGAMP